MSEQDRELLIKAGLSAAKAARILNRSRQAVSRGIAAEPNYLAPSDLIALRTGILSLHPENVEPFQEATGQLLRELAERLGSTVPDQVGMATTIAEAHRLWLILPGFSESFAKQREHYHDLIHRIDQRRPVPGSSAQLEIVAFCDKNRAEIEEHFAPSWFETRHLAVVQCALVERMFTPIIVVNPHLDGGTACYTLAKNGFEPLEPEVARLRVNEFAGHVSDRIRDTLRAAGVQSVRPSMNILTAAPTVLLDAGLDEMKI